MTKSGIGTNGTTTTSTSSNNLTTNTNLSTAAATATTSNQTSSGSSSSTSCTTTTASLIASAEIPIWVADKKKWVTGISKKTTINDLIYAILKQCQLIHSPHTQSNLNSQFELIAAQYVLVEYSLESGDSSGVEHNINLASQRILSGDSKVYKYLSKWTNSQLISTHQQQQQQASFNQNLMLKILQRQPENSDHDNQPQHQQQQHQSTSLATKLLKKFGVNSVNNNNMNQSNITNSSKTVSTNLSASSSSSSSQSFKLVDVKLPHLSTPPAAVAAPQAPPPQIKSPQTQLRNFDPNTQKSFLYNAILEKDTKLKQQIKRFQLIDELIKQTEKKSSNSLLLHQLNADTVINNPTYTYSPSSSQSSSLSSSNSSTCNNNNQTVPINPINSNLDVKQQLNTVDLNDVYCHFPEMCTHHLKEVEDFTLMCSQLFQLEEAIKSQKQVLSSLELDLQRELSLNQFNQHQQQQQQHLIQPTQETSETLELRNEVNYSREQTRLQCKQLHDLDLRMRQNEQSLMLKEQQLQQLLEELYIQEIYADNALESAITSTTTPSNQMFLSPKQAEENYDAAATAARHTELIIKNEFDTNSKYMTKRHVKMFGDSNDDMLINQALQQTQQTHSIRLTNQQQGFNMMNSSCLQQKSQSIGNLAKCLPSPPQVPPNVLVSSHFNHSGGLKQSKTTNFNTTTTTTTTTSSNNAANLNSDHSGDNDSGISSMSSETTPTNQASNSTPPPYLQQQQQRQQQFQQQQYHQPQFQQLYRHTQQQQQPQQTALLNASPVGKSVLETLV